MCCLFTVLVFLGPRVGILVWGLIDPVRWSAAFDTFIWPLAGFILAPWTTLMYVAVYPLGISALDWVWLGLAILADIASWSGGAYGNRSRIQGYASA
jgi:hypothetical protein